MKVARFNFDTYEGVIRRGSGESYGENLERMRSSLSLKNWRNEFASECLSGVSGDELQGFRWSIEIKVSQSVRGLYGI